MAGAFLMSCKRAFPDCMHQSVCQEKISTQNCKLYPHNDELYQDGVQKVIFSVK